MLCRDSAAPSVVTLLGRSLANAEHVALQTLPDVWEPELGYLKPNLASLSSPTAQMLVSSVPIDSGLLMTSQGGRRVCRH